MPPALPVPVPPGRGSIARFSVAVAITVLAILSQYFVPELVPAARGLYASFAGDLAVVYGIPIVAFVALVGTGPLAGWRSRLSEAAWRGLGWYGLLSLLGLGVLIALVVLYEFLDPSALELLKRLTPVQQGASPDPLVFVPLAFGVGAVEETIFRGWIYGFWRRASRGWVGPAVGSSALFAGVHLYYATTYGPATPLIVPTLFLAGFAFAATYESAGGNLVVPALLHGQMDAIAFYALVAPAAADALHYGIVLAGAAVAGVAYAFGRWGTVAPAPATPPPAG